MVTLSEATVDTKSLIVNPSLVLLQRRLFSPSYDGPGKWVVFDPSTRKSLLAVLQQRDYEERKLPAVLRLLLAQSRGEPTDDASASAQLVRAGLLVESGANASGSTFLSAFQQSVFDYPFFDYSTPDTFEQDRHLMATYHAASPAPPPWTPREGTRVALPSVDWNDLAPLSGQTFGLRQLAAVLRFAFGPIGELAYLGPRMHYRRTSPSGGAKHPTEGWLHVAAPWGGLDVGVYVYDCANHALVRAGTSDRIGEPPNGQPLSISVRSRVERPMWRYRDGRSFRAVLIDAGHVIETLAILLGVFGISATARPGGRGRHDPAWLREPEVAVLVPQLLPHGMPALVPANRQAGAAEEPADGLPSPLVTNPAMYFTLEDGRFRGRIVHPLIAEYPADEIDFAILTHCILSHRGDAHRPGDRLTTPTAVIDKVLGATDERLRRLVQVGALMSDEDARPLYGEVRRWAERGWYQPLLTWLEAVNAEPVIPDPPATLRRPETDCDIPTALKNRVTTRAFSTEPIDDSSLLALLADSYAVDESTATVDCYVAALNVDGYPASSLHTWDRHSKTLIPTGRSISAADVIDMTIGQQWLKNSAAAIWFVTKIDVAHPGTYLLSNVLLGRMAQSICLLGTDRGLGVFQTPAIEDRKFSAKIGIREDPTLTAYLVCVGKRARGDR